jgi:antitoxin component of MazEF toxin-antitoxin module
MIYDDLHLSICKNIEFAIQNNRKMIIAQKERGRAKEDRGAVEKQRNRDK